MSLPGEPEMTGSEVGSWILEGKLGAGGMGEVYLARHRTLGTPAAVKVLAPALCSEENFRERFEREANVQADLRHPHIARVLDYLERDGRWFLVVEYLDGGSLAERIARADGPVPRDRALTWSRQALEALHYAHGKGVVHRDVKPGNILLNEHGQVAVTDFGIAKVGGGRRLTSTGVSVGTPEYMSPEQIRTPDRVDRRTDVYSMGVVLYELLAGRVPFEADSAFEVQRAQVCDAPPRLLEIGCRVPEELEAVVLQALAKAPEDRFQDCMELVSALAPFEAGAGRAPTAPTAPVHRATVLEPTPPPLPAADAAQPGGGSPASPTAPARQATVVDSGPGALPAEPVPAHHRTPTVLAPAPNRAPVPVSRTSGARRRRRTAVAAAGLAALLALGAGGYALLRGTWGNGGESVEGSEEEAGSAGGGGSAVGAPDEGGPSEGSAEAGAEPASGAPAAGGSPAGQEGAGGGVQPLQEGPGGPAPPEGPSGAASSHPAAGDGSAGTAGAPGTGNPAGGPAPGPGAAGAPGTGRPAGGPAPGPGSALQGATPPAGIAGPGGGRRPPGPPPEQPVVAVLAQGDPVLAAPLAQTLEERLLRAGFDVQDVHNSLELSELIEERGDRLSQRELLPALVRAGYHVLVQARVQVGERREIELRRQRGSFTSGMLRLNSYLLPAQQAMGRGWSERVEYSELSADAKAEQALLGGTAEMVQAIRDGWSGYRDRMAAVR